MPVLPGIHNIDVSNLFKPASKSSDSCCQQVTITDSGTPPLSSTVQVIVFVDDENDNSPQFDQTFYHIMIPEVQHKDSTFIIQVKLSGDFR